MPKFDPPPQIEPDVQKEVDGDLVESLFDSFGSFSASLVGGVAAPASAWLMTSEPIYIELTIIMSLLAIYRILVWFGHSKTPLVQRRNEATKWEIYYAIGGISFVTTLGLTVAILFVRDHIDIAFTISFVTMMAGVGALSGRNAGSPKIVLAQLIGLCGPLAFVTAIDADHRHHWLTFILILEMISIKSTTRFLNRNLVTALTNARDAKIQRNRFKAALNSMAQGLCMGDGGSVITVMNHRMIEFFSIVGVTAPISLQVLAWTIGKRSHMSKGESKAFGDQWCAHVALPFASVFSHQFNDRLFDFHCEPAGEGGFVTVIEDVTEKRKAAKEIERIAHYRRADGPLESATISKEIDARPRSDRQARRNARDSGHRSRSVQGSQRYAWSFDRRPASVQGRETIARERARHGHGCAIWRRRILRLVSAEQEIESRRTST